MMKMNETELEQVTAGSSESPNNRIEIEGIVTEQLPNAVFTVQLDNGQVIKAHLSGRLRMNYIRVVCGDRVTVEMDPNNNSIARIIYRFKQ
jgi:translation initiation factor IF-1